MSDITIKFSDKGGWEDTTKIKDTKYTKLCMSQKHASSSKFQSDHQHKRKVSKAFLIVCQTPVNSLSFQRSNLYPEQNNKNASNPYPV